MISVIQKYWIIVGLAVGMVLMEFLGLTPTIRKYTIALFGIGIVVVAFWLLSEAKAHNSDDHF